MPMVTAVLIVAVLNLVLGYGLARCSEQPWWIAWWGRQRWRAGRSAQTGLSTGSTSLASDGDARRVTAWRDQLRGEAVQPRSDLECLLWMMHIHTPRLRAELLSVDLAVRQSPGHWPREEVQALAGDWTRNLDDWLGGLREVADPTHSEATHPLEELLLDQAYETEQIVAAIEADDVGRGTPGADAARHLARLHQTFDAVQSFVDEQLAERIRSQDNLNEVCRGRDVDPGSGALSRLGMEELCARWWREDPDRVRLVSCVLIDVDRTAKLNDSHGIAACDGAMQALGRLLRDLVRKDRGFDFVVRYGGQAYLLFLGDTGLKNACSGAERIRQTIEVTAFEAGHRPIELTASLGVVEVRHEDTLSELLQRLEACIGEAKETGRNRTCVDDPAGPKPVALPQYQVTRKSIPAGQHSQPAEPLLQAGNASNLEP